MGSPHLYRWGRMSLIEIFRYFYSEYFYKKERIYGYIATEEDYESFYDNQSRRNSRSI